MATKYEDQVDRFGDFDSIDPYHSPFSLPWVQLWWKMNTFSRRNPHTEIFWHDDILREISNIHDLVMYVVNFQQSADQLFC